MSRSNRHDYLASLPPQRISRRAMNRILRAVGIPEAKPKKEQKPKRLWGYIDTNHGRQAVFSQIYGGIPTVEAYTRSEARAEVKRELGISRHRRLPAHIEIVEIDPNDLRATEEACCA